MEKCPNCKNEFIGNYCNNCGQKRIRSDMTIKMVLSDFVKTVFLFDSTLYKTLIGFLFSPGNSAKTFMQGKRRAYLPPFQFFLLFMTIYLLVLNFFGDTFFDYINSGLQIDGDKFSKAELIQTLVRKNLNVLYFIFAPIIAFFIYVFYKKTKSNYAETLIFAMYIVGVSFLLSSTIVLLGQVNSKIFMSKMLITLGYFAFAIVQFTDSKSFWGVLKALLSIISSYLMFVLVILILVSIYVYLFLI